MSSNTIWLKNTAPGDRVAVVLDQLEELGWTDVANALKTGQSFLKRVEGDYFQEPAKDYDLIIVQGIFFRGNIDFNKVENLRQREANYDNLIR